MRCSYEGSTGAHTAEYARVQAVAASVIAGYAFGTPLVFFLLLRRAKVAILSHRSTRFSRAIHILHDDYWSPRYYWEVRVLGSHSSPTLCSRLRGATIPLAHSARHSGVIRRDSTHHLHGVLPPLLYRDASAYPSTSLTCPRALSTHDPPSQFTFTPLPRWSSRSGSCCSSA